MPHSHPTQFAFQRYEYSGRENYHDYYQVALKEPMGGFPRGERFEAASIRSDGAIHGRQNGKTFYLGKMDKSTSSPARRTSYKNDDDSYSNYQSYNLSSPRSPRSSSTNRYGWSLRSDATSSSLGATSPRRSSSLGATSPRRSSSLGVTSPSSPRRSSSSGANRYGWSLNASRSSSPSRSSSSRMSACGGGLNACGGGLNACGSRMSACGSGMNACGGY